MSGPISAELSHWAAETRFADLPTDVVESTKLRVLDMLGLALAGLETPFGSSMRAAALETHAGGRSRVWGSGDRLTAAGAALVNGACAQALEYDDTHNTSIVHMSAPSVAAALALAEHRGDVSGRELLRAIAIGNEIACRVGSAAPGQFHKRGFHPTGLFAVFGATWLSGVLNGASVAQMAHAAGIAGSFASGVLQCWVDGAQSKFIHPGWAAHGGICADAMARAGATGPAGVFEGRFGLFASHLQSEQDVADLDSITRDLGGHWESRNASFKPYPTAHVIHPYLDAALRLQREAGFDASDVVAIVCPVAPYQVGIVCAPEAEKRRPKTDSHGRVSLQYSLAEALVKRRLGRDGYAASSLIDPDILALADKVTFEPDESFPGPERFKAIVRVRLHDGRELETIEEDNRGSVRNPMSLAEINAKFTENCAGVLTPAQIDKLGARVLSLESADNAVAVVDKVVAGHG